MYAASPASVPAVAPVSAQARRSTGTTRREAVPMPPFRPKQVIPVPLPTAPVAGAPASAPRAAASARRTSPGSIWVRGEVLRYPSSHSATTGSSASSSPIAGSSSASAATAASATRPSAIVEVRKTGVSMTPHSPIWVMPIASPAPLRSAAPAGTRDRKSSPGSKGTIAVTPVRATPRPAGGGGSSRQTVACPTRTPVTSAMLSVGPGGKWPMRIPRSRARQRVGGGPGTGWRIGV